MPKNTLLYVKSCKYRGLLGAQPRDPHFLICTIKNFLSPHFHHSIITVIYNIIMAVTELFRDF